MATKNEVASALYTRLPFATSFPMILHTYNVHHQPSFRHRSPPPPYYHSRILSPPPPPHFCLYNVHFQPSLTFPVLPPPSPITNTTTNHSLPSRSMIPKPLRLKVNDKVFRFANYGAVSGGAQRRNGNHVIVVGKQQRDLGFQGGQKRWKNNKSNDYHQLLPMEAYTTSLMIKNIPNRYTRKLLIKTLDDHCKLQNQDNDYVSAYDFVYLPIDFTNGYNAGFAFVNFTNSKAALKFKDVFHGKSWDLFASSKVAEISRARIQGKEALKSNCKRMDFTFGSEEDMPVVFEPARDGSGLVGLGMYTLGKWYR